MADSATVMVMVNSFAAMAKIFLVFGVGVLCAIYPKKDPLLPVSSLRYLSRLSNLVFIPALIIYSLGSALSADLLGKIGVLILFSLASSGVSFALGATIGKLMHEKNNDDLFTAVYVSIGSPNAISLPIMVMQTLCDSSTFNADFDNDTAQCFAAANSMMFVYSIGWHLQFWSYAFPLLQNIGNPAAVEEKGAFSLAKLIKQYDFRDAKRRDEMKDWVHRVLLTPVFLSIYLGMFIGLIPPLQAVLFRANHALYFAGSAIQTVSTPVVCLQSLIMAASLAHGDFSVFIEGYHNLKGRIGGVLFHSPAMTRSGAHDVLTDETVNPVHDQKDVRYAELTAQVSSGTDEDVESNATGNSDEHKTAGVLSAGSVVNIEATRPSDEEVGSKLPEWRSVGALVLCR